RFADIDLAGRRRRLEALRKDHRVAEDGVIHPDIRPDDPRDRVTGVYADVEGELLGVRELTSQARELLLHLERDEEGPRSIVLVSDRRAEQREQRVAGELLNVAVVAADDVAQPRYHGIDHLEQLFRVEQIGEASESRDVREQRGYQPSLLRQLTACRGDAVGYALGDEGAERVGDVRLRLGGRRARSCGRPAVAAELRAGRV